MSDTDGDEEGKPVDVLTGKVSTATTSSISAKPSCDLLTPDKKTQLGCLKITTLQTNRPGIKSTKKVWSNMLKTLNTIKPQDSPNTFDVLRGSYIGSMRGGGDAVSDNKEFINPGMKEIDIGYSFTIREILEKALRRLNLNKIYLDEATIESIKTHLKTLFEQEQALIKVGEQIVKASRISDRLPKNTTDEVKSNEELNQYIQDHENLLKGANRNAMKLNNVLLEFVNLSNSADVKDIIDGLKSIGKGAREARTASAATPSA